MSSDGDNEYISTDDDYDDRNTKHAVDFELLKVSAEDFKHLTSEEQRVNWITTHFIIKKFEKRFKSKEINEEEEEDNEEDDDEDDEEVDEEDDDDDEEELSKEEESNVPKKKGKKLYFKLGDGKFVIDEDYLTESKAIRTFYRCGFHGAIPAKIKGKSSRIIRLALQFSKDRGQIKKQHKNKNDDYDNLLLQQKLKDFDDSFLQQNHADAIDLADVACRLQMKSLYYQMRRTATNMIFKMTPDEIRKIFDVYYDENKTDSDTFKMMKYTLRNAAWAFKPIM